MNYAILTVGNRDIKLSENINREFDGCREMGDFLLTNFSKLKDKIELPIIQPFLDDIKKRKIKIDKFYLIATDQEYGDYKKSDTINFARVIKLHLERKNYKVKIILLSKNVNNFMSNYSFFENRFSDFESDKVNKYYILPVGGMPNINTPLLLTSIFIFREKVVQYNVDKIQRNAYQVPFNQKLLKAIENEKIKILLENFYFASISNISSDDFIKRISKYTYNRLSQNFDKSKIIIDNMMIEYLDNNLMRFSESIANIRNNSEKKLEEMYFSARIKIEQSQFVDALLRLYNFTDNLLLEEVCKLYRLDEKTNSFRKWWEKSYKKISKENPNITDDLDEINGSKAQLSQAGIPLYEKLIKFKDEENPIFEIIKPLISITELRNKSIGAHGFDSVSINKINDKLSYFNINLRVLLQKIEKYINISFEKSDYSEIVRLIENRLEK
ncbi:MAG: hypothetical protein U9N76_01440 [Candidatus Marinimicrobia bacterium]|nr:hypothetical protein [Candidatus Neomarinimicrobiota bacterium]